MNDNDELKARSVELAERAIRLRDRAIDTDTQEKLHYVSNELINISNSQRFYDAQKPLEIAEHWTEDQRALAHEISVADRQIKGLLALDIRDAIDKLFDMVEKSANSSDEATTTLASNLCTLIESNDANQKKTAISYVLGFLEDALQHFNQEETQQNELADPAILEFRSMRDSLLVHRELLYDEADLQNNYETEGDKIERLGLIRHQLDEIYKR